MSDQGFPSQPPQPPDAPAPDGSATGRPPFQPPVAPAARYGWAPPQPGWQPAPAPRRRRAWMWWTLGVLLLVGLIVASCAVPFALLFGDSDLASAGGEAVGVIHVDGVIAGTGEYYSGYVTPEYFRGLLEQAQEDDSVKAIVLRVDSPGGTVAASEEIASYVARCPKPVIVSSGDVNASGAYMVSSQADEIWAMPGTSVGSIGVITEIPNVDGLMEKLGVDFTVITAGKYKDAGSPFRELTDKERALIQGQVNEAYGQFIDLVAKGRDMSRSEVETLATGWAWSGERARELGLVDRLGDYSQALDAAAEAGGIEGDYEIITYDDGEFGELFGSIFGVSQSIQRLAAVLEQSMGTDARSVVPR